MSAGDDYLGAVRSPRSSVARRPRRVALLVAFTLVLSLIALGTPVSAVSADPWVVHDYSELMSALEPGNTGDIEIVGGFQLDAPVTIGRDVLIYGTGLKAEDVTITAPSNSPAFIVASGTSVTIKTIAFVGANDRKAEGGAVSVETGATLLLDAVSFHDNFAGEGGGIYNAGDTTITNSVFYNNEAAGKGGGVSNDGTLTVVNSTFAKNNAQQGGAVSTAGLATFTFVTIVGNSSKNKIGAGTHLTGGTIELDNSIVANNYSGGSFYDCSGQTDVNHVLFSSTQGCQPSGTEGTDYKVVAAITFPNSEVPADNGGPTKTVALVDQSGDSPVTADNFDHPAAAYGIDCIESDQRGVQRPQPDGCDIGAFEREFIPPVVTLTATPPPNNNGWNNTSVAVAISANEPTSSIQFGFDNSTFSEYAGPIDVSREGEGIVVYAKATDLDGNVGMATLSPPLNIDLTDPTVSATKTARADGGWDITITASDDLSGIARISYALDGGGAQTYTAGPVTITTPGPHTISYSATDRAGNESSDTIDATVVPLTLDITDFTTSTPSVEVGAVTVPLENLPTATAAAEEFGSTASTQLSAIQLSAIQLSAIQLSAIQLSAIATEAAQLSAIQLSAIQLSAILTEALQLSAIQLSAISLSDIQLSAIGEDNYSVDSISDLLCDDNGSTDYCGIPLQALTLSDLIDAEPGITLADIDFGSTQLSAIQLSAILLVQLPMETIQLSAIDNHAAWCDALGLTTDSGACTNLDLTQSLYDLDPTAYTTLDSTQLSAIQLSAIQLSAIANWWGTLDSTQLSAIQLSAIQLSAIDWASTQLSAIQLSAIQLSAIGWLSTQLSAIQLSAIGTIPAQLSAIQLSAIQLSAIPLCTTDPESVCSEGVTLQVLFDAGYLDGLTLLDLADAGILDDVALGDLADMGVLDDPSLTIADLLQLFTEEPLASSDYSLADLLFALVPSTSVAWEDLGSDLAALPLADAADNSGTTRSDVKQPSFDYALNLNVQGPTALVDVGLTLPDGFSFARPDGTVPDSSIPYVRLDGAGDGSIQPVAFDAGATCLTSADLAFLDLELTPGTHTLEIPVWAGTTLGEFPTDVTACAEAGTQTADAGPATASIQVTEGAPASSTITSGDLELAQLTAEHPVHEYQFTLTGRAQARIKLTNLTADLDLELFGPSMQDPLRGTPQTDYGSAKDFIYSLVPGSDSLDANTLNDLPLEPPSGEVLHAVVANRGTTDEVIDTGALNPGTYTIRVSGYNGATVDDAFALRLRTTPLPELTCSISQSWSTPSSSPAPPTGINTVFLYDSKTYGNATDLLTLVADQRWADEGITAAAVAVDQYPTVVDELNAWAANYCDPLAANDVVRAIGSAVLDPILAANPDLEYIVIIGDDSQIPSARMTDGTFVSNEAAHGLTLTDLDAIKAALVEGYYLSDHPYAAPRGYAIADREFFVPTAAIGRLVGSSSQIGNLIDSHLANNGVLANGTATGDAVVAGYDFLADGAQAAANALSSDFNVDDSLINEMWTKSSLSSALDTSPSLAVIEAHYDQSRLLPANENLAGTQTNLFDVEQYLALGSPPSFMLTPGCHSALWLYGIANWADTNSLMGNYGYGYGDSDTVALSERLVELTAKRLGSMTIGEAQRAATFAYLGELYTITPYDLKVMEEFTLFGLPMAHLTTTTTAPTALSTTAATTASPTVFNDPYTGLESTSSSLDYNDLTSLDPTPSAWKDAGYGLLTVRGRAILPQQTVDVTANGRQAGGVLITGLTSSPNQDFAPVVFNPVAGEQYPGGTTTATSGPTAGEMTFPASIQSVVKRVIGDDGEWHDQVVIVPARHYTDAGSEIEFFTNVQIQTVYRPAGWVGPSAVPTIEETIGRYGNGVVHFGVTIQSPTGTSTKRVLVLFRQQGSSGPWQTVDLASADGVHWLGGRPPASGNQGPFEYFIQGVDNDGDVFQATGKAINYDTIQPELDQGVSVTVTDSGTPAFGWYPGRTGDDVVATATSTSPLCSYTLDGTTHVLSGGSSATIGIDGDGGHLLQVSAGDDCSPPDKEGLLFVAIDGTPPQVEANVTRGADGSQIVSLTAFDPFGSGVASIEYRVGDSGTWQPYSEPVRLNLTQTTTVSYRATDIAGNESQIGDVSVVAYGFCYLYDPDKGTSGTVAVKIRITSNTWDVQCDGSEDNLSSNALKVYAYRLDGGSVSPQDSGKANSSPTYQFRYDSKLKGYIYNLNDALTDGDHVLQFTINQDWTDTATYPDGSGLITYPARFVYKNS